MYLITDPSSYYNSMVDNYGQIVTRVWDASVIFILFLAGIALIKYVLASLSN